VEGQVNNESIEELRYFEKPADAAEFEKDEKGFGRPKKKDP
jgi:hypothetical protein